MSVRFSNLPMVLPLIDTHCLAGAQKNPALLMMTEDITMRLILFSNFSWMFLSPFICFFNLNSKVWIFKKLFLYEWTSDQLIILNTFFSSKLDSPAIKTLERIRFFSNQSIGEGKSNFDEKNIKEMFNWSEFHSKKKCYL